MPIVEEEGGRLNAYAKEPRMEIINHEDTTSRASWIIIIFGALLVVGLITVTVSIS